MKIQILVDNKNSWIVPFAQELVQEFTSMNHEAKLIHEHKHVEEGDILCLLGCEKIFKQLNKNDFNLVVHESDLPKGKGWSPLTWQILEGKNKIPIILFEATQGVDSGDIYFKDYIILKGHELLDEIKYQQGLKTKELIHRFITNFPEVKGEKQTGEETFYRKRTPKDSEVDIKKTIEDQFNLLRVVDNERYPAFFIRDNKKYIIKVIEE